jgi:hypothetical protein
MVRRRVTMTLALHAADQQQYGAAWWCRMVAAPIFGSINATSLTGFGPVSAVEQKQSPPNVTWPCHDMLPATRLVTGSFVLYRNLRGAHTVRCPPSSNGLAVTVWHRQGVWLISAPDHSTRGSPSDPCRWGSSGSCGCVLKLEVVKVYLRRETTWLLLYTTVVGYSTYGPPTRHNHHVLAGARHTLFGM